MGCDQLVHQRVRVFNSSLKDKKNERTIRRLAYRGFERMAEAVATAKGGTATVEVSAVTTDRGCSALAFECTTTGSMSDPYLIVLPLIGDDVREDWERLKVQSFPLHETDDSSQAHLLVPLTFGSGVVTLEWSGTSLRRFGVAPSIHLFGFTDVRAATGRIGLVIRAEEARHGEDLVRII